jgi:putative PIN family toxin of toxin-antitoxin system
VLGDDLPRIVLDTNVFVSGTILPRGASTGILQAWRQNTFTLLTSVVQIAELIDVLERPKFVKRYNVGNAEIAALVRRIEATAVTLEILDPQVIELRDPDDEIILATAMTGKARFLVTGDEDLLSVREDSRLFPLQVARPAEFIDRLTMGEL